MLPRGIHRHDTISEKMDDKNNKNHQGPQYIQSPMKDSNILDTSLHIIRSYHSCQLYHIYMPKEVEMVILMPVTFTYFYFYPYLVK